MIILIFENKWTGELLVYPKLLASDEIPRVVEMLTKGGNWRRR